MVGADVALKTAIVVCLKDLKNTCVTVAISMARLREIAVFKMLYVSLIVVYKNMAYQINAPKQYKNEIIEMLSTTFSIKVM